jgi:non-specific serine/threonine protein kinase/serine/threonine-protein kinase
MTATRAGALIAGRYELGPLLRRGGMADVHAGTDGRLQRDVAIKLLRPDMAHREDVRLRFEAEARSAAKLTHPCAVAVYDTGEHEGAPYIVMERLPGRTLADMIADGPVDPAWLLPAAEGVLSALGAAHDAAIVHRDVKPGNILVTDAGTAKIADFGIAKSAELASGTAPGSVDITLTGQLVGTPAYLAPERLAGAPATFLSDLYSMGVVLYEALSGEKPFTGPSFVAVAHAVQGGDRRPLREVAPDVDPEVAAAVEQAMDRDPSRRFPSAEAMASALLGREAATTALPVAAATEETTELATDAVTATQVTEAAPLPLSPTRRRMPLAVPIGAAIGLLVILLVVLGMSGGENPSPTVNTAPVSTETSAPPTTATTAAPEETVAPPVADATPNREAPRNGKKGRRGNRD